MEHLVSPAIVALLQVILIDIVLAGDNAVVIGMAAARVPIEKRRKVIAWGLAAAVVLRVILATLTASLLAIIGLMFAGGILLLWVCWRLYRDLHEAREKALAEKSACPGDAQPTPASIEMNTRRAIFQIIVADLSMSLDNVLAVAGAATYHVWVLAVGLLLSIALMGLAASMIANLLQRFPWISYAGLIIVLYVAVRMVYDGGMEIFHAAT